ncbi:DUF421 domain-containing protein [Heyndrickxia sp. NPDC080065]|uniref:DUF421 domain-containing protein n=1 Tax=Heyndrickxia sp. NPDC080065 TaxID=3390568 RepID=UPI003CFFB3FD
MSDLIEILIRSVFAFFLFMIIAHFLGKQTISRMTSHHFIAAATFGSITANLAFNIRNEAWQVTAAMIIFFISAFISSVISLKYRNARKWLSGKPTVIIENGKILEENLGKIRLTMDTLNHVLRQKDIFDINEVQFAIVEPNGELSVLKKPDYRYLTRKDIGLFSSEGNQFPIELIMERKMVEQNLTDNGLTKEWLITELSKRGFNLSDVFYAVKGTNNHLYFDLYKDRISSPIDKEK